MRTAWIVLSACLFQAAIAHAQPQWRLEADLKIGAEDGPSALTVIPYATMHPDGTRIYIAQPMENRVRIFDARTGRPISSFGKRGAGPGEFESIGALGWSGRELTVADTKQSRISWFTGEGVLIRTQRIAPLLIEPMHTVMAARVTPSGTFWAEPMHLSVVSIARGDMTSSPLRMVNAEGRVVRPVADLDLRGAYFTVKLGKGGGFYEKPLTPLPLHAYDPSGGSAVFVKQQSATQQTPAFSVLRVDHIGARMFDANYSYTPERVPQRAKDSIQAQYLKAASRSAPPRALQAAREGIPVPETYPPVTQVMVLSSGQTWLRRQPAKAGVATWMILDPKGNVEATVRAPAGMRLLTGNATQVWGVVLDDLDVPYMVRYRIVK